MVMIYEKPEFYFVKGYRNYLDVTPPTRHLTHICCSEFNRYPAQTQYIKSMMEENRTGAVKILNIGVAQGQEPLTHINSAFELSQRTNRPISDFINLQTVDILSAPPVLPDEAYDKFDKKVIGFLQNTYDRRSGNSLWGMPVEKAVDEMLKNNQKQDIILFNNVLQHMSAENDDSLFEKLDKLLKLINDDGIFCFTVSGHTTNNFENTRIQRMQTLLRNNGFEEIQPQTGIFKKVML